VEASGVAVEAVILEFRMGLVGEGSKAIHHGWVEAGLSVVDPWGTNILNNRVYLSSQRCWDLLSLFTKRGRSSPMGGYPEPCYTTFWNQLSGLTYNIEHNHISIHESPLIIIQFQRLPAHVSPDDTPISVATAHSTSLPRPLTPLLKRATRGLAAHGGNFVLERRVSRSSPLLCTY
jgi:hypothetical protein